MHWQLGALTIDETAFEVRLGEEVLRVEPLVLRLILLLIRNRERVVSKQEMIDALWYGEAVSDSAITRAVSIARGVLRRSGTNQPIRSVYGTGYQLQLSPRSGANASIADHTHAFVGRSPEMARIARRLEGLKMGRGCLCLVSGEAGIGKTTLLERAVEAAESFGFAIRVGRCLESGGAPPYWPWVQVLRAEFSDGGMLSANELDASERQLLEELASNRTMHPSAGSPPGTRFGLFDSIARVLAARSQLVPRVIALDDIHAADRESLALLGLLATNLRTSPIMILASYRSGEVELSDRKAVVAAATSGESLNLGGLNEQDVEQLLEDSGLDHSSAPELHDRTGGNPLFLQHLIDARGPAHAGHESGELPSGLADLIRHELSSLPQKTIDVLVAAAVLGTDFETQTLDLICQRPCSDVIASVVPRGILRPSTVGPEGRYRFGHSVTREFLYRSLSPDERSGLHAQAAEILSHQVEADPAHVAHHYQLAIGTVGLEPAISWTVRAATNTAGRHAHEEAASRHEEAEALFARASEGDSVGRIENLIGLAQARGRGGDRESAWRASEAAARLAVQCRKPLLVADAALSLSPGILSIETAHFDARQVLLLEEAISQVRGHDEATLVELLSRLTTALYWSDRHEQRRKAADEALQLSARLDSPVRASAIYAKHADLWRPGSSAERLKLARRLVRLAEPQAGTETAAIYRSVLITDLAEAGDVSGLRLEIARFRRDAESARNPISIWLSPMFQGMLELLVGNFGAIPPLNLELLDLGRRIGSEDAANCLAAQNALYRFEHGEGALVIDDLLSHAADHPNVLQLFQTAPAWASSELGREAEARSFLDGFCRSEFADIPWDMNWLGATTVLAMAAAEVRDRDACEKLFELLAPFEAQFAVLGYGAVSFGSVAAHLGRLAAVIGRDSEAARLFEVGIRDNSRAGARPWVARALYGYGTAVLRRGRTEQGHRMLREALGLTRALGMTHMSNRCRIAMT